MKITRVCAGGFWVLGEHAVASSMVFGNFVRAVLPTWAADVPLFNLCLHKLFIVSSDSQLSSVL